MADRKDIARNPKDERETSAGPNEGEGNRTFARKFNADERRFVESGQVDEKAREAEEALAGNEGDELRRAEEAGKSRSKGEDPTLKRPSKRTKH